MGRRFVLTGGLATFLAGCAESPIIVNAFEALKFSVVGFPNPPIERNVISKLPYASISAKIGIGPRALLILWRRDRDDLHWISADRAVVVTRHGRVVKTFGFPETSKTLKTTAVIR